jgi:hypothetical protein
VPLDLPAQCPLQGNTLQCIQRPCCDRCEHASPGAACTAGATCFYGLQGSNPECYASCATDGLWHFECPQTNCHNVKEGESCAVGYDCPSCTCGVDAKWRCGHD